MTGDKLAVPIVVGTRPEAIKLVPIILALRDDDSYHPIVVSTGQHHWMVQDIFELAGITTDVDLWVGEGRSGLNERVASVIRRFEDFCREWFGAEGKAVATTEELLSGHFPVAVIVHGDTSSAFAAALAAFHLRIPVMHVEAGLRTDSNLTPFPEELNRELISCIACFHCAPTSANQQNLVREEIPVDQIFVTGNTGIDALQWASGLAVPFEDPSVQELYDGDARIVAVTAHRRENWATGLTGIAEGLARLARSHPDVRFVLPLHPNPTVREKLKPPLEGVENVLLTEPMGYPSFARLLARSHMVITDSGGIQEEAPSLDKPVLVARETTERQEGVAAGTLLLVGTDPERIVTEASRLLTDETAYARMARAHNPYGDGHAAERIVAALDHLSDGGPPPHPFGSGYSRRAVLAAAGYEEALDPREVPANERGEPEQPEPGVLWPS
ncbi:MAG: non-hydrolyzing UDP-N-acetylglucosamine 2-epimerase [Solirubrobacterales bacterium]